MGVYVTTRCGHCDYAWAKMEYGDTGEIGPPVIKCRNCLGMNNTKQLLYRDSDGYTKFVFWGRTILNAFFFGLGTIIMGVGFFVKLEGNLKWFGILPFLTGVIVLYQTSLTTKAAKALEETYDNNVGFLWSDEAFPK